MLRLAIEMSTTAGSLALTEDGAARANRGWNQKDRPHQVLFDILPGFLRDAGVAPADIGHYVVGIGPGSFSGIRVALAAANGLALPGGIPVHGLPSAAALAWDTLRAVAAGDVAIVGDARRNRCWVGRYRRCADGLETLAEPALHPLDALGFLLNPDTAVLSPDWERLNSALEQAFPGVQLVREPRTPTAMALAELAEQHLRRNAPLHPPQPLYLHPPV